MRPPSRPEVLAAAFSTRLKQFRTCACRGIPQLQARDTPIPLRHTPAPSSSHSPPASQPRAISGPNQATFTLLDRGLVEAPAGCPELAAGQRVMRSVMGRLARHAMQGSSGTLPCTSGRPGRGVQARQIFNLAKGFGLGFAAPKPL